MLRFVALSCLVLAGCGSTGSAGVPTPDPRHTTLISSETGSIQITTHRDTRGSFHRLEASPQQVWSVLAEVYRELQIEIGTMDSAALILGNARLNLSGRLGTTPLATFLSCGNEPFGAPTANSAQIQMSVLTAVQAAGGATRLETRVDASARKRGAASDPVHCSSTGRLEERIARLVAERLDSAG